MTYSSHIGRVLLVKVRSARPAKGSSEKQKGRSEGERQTTTSPVLHSPMMLQCVKYLLPLVGLFPCRCYSLSHILRLKKRCEGKGSQDTTSRPPLITRLPWTSLCIIFVWKLVPQTHRCITVRLWLISFPTTFTSLTRLPFSLPHPVSSTFLVVFRLLVPEPHAGGDVRLQRTTACGRSRWEGKQGAH